MKIKPVEVSAVPKYPDKYTEEVQHALLSAKPNRWRGTPLATVGLSAVVALGLSGCAPDYMTSGSPTPFPTIPVVSPSNFDPYVTMGSPEPFTPLPYDAMIPLFEYGEGTGAIGCVSIAAPVFLSEEEAFAILSAVFAEAGLTLSQGAVSLKNINLPLTNIYESGSEESQYATVQKDIIPDGMLRDDLPVIFVSTKDVGDWHDGTEMTISSSSYNVKKAAQALAKSNPNLVVFYDPIASVDYARLWDLKQEDGESNESYYVRRTAAEQEASNAARAESERLLRLQAEAVVNWFEDGGHC